jgi:hypothetical protein
MPTTRAQDRSGSANSSTSQNVRAPAPQQKKKPTKKESGESVPNPKPIQTPPATPSKPSSDASASSPSCITSASPTSTASTGKTPKFKFHIKNIPENLANQKTFHNFLITNLNIRTIDVLIVNRNRTVLLITTSPTPENLNQQLRTASNSRDVEMPENAPVLKQQKNRSLLCRHSLGGPRHHRERRERRTRFPRTKNCSDMEN